MWWRRRVRTASVVGGLVVGLGIGAAVAAFAIEDHVFYACHRDGEVSMATVTVDTEPTCRAGTELVSWNSQGPVGPQGPQGDPGPAGPAGPQGPPGVAATYVVTAVFDQVLSGGAGGTMTLKCDPGDLATGGGHRLSQGPVGKTNFYASFPAGPNNHEWWNFAFYHDQAGSVSVRIVVDFYVVCLDVSDT